MTNKWEAKPSDDRKQRLYDKLKIVLKRNKAVARSLGQTITKVNQIVRGWINYFKVGKCILPSLEVG